MTILQVYNVYGNDGEEIDSTDGWDPARQTTVLGILLSDASGKQDNASIKRQGALQCNCTQTLHHLNQSQRSKGMSPIEGQSVEKGV